MGRGHHTSHIQTDIATTKPNCPVGRFGENLSAQIGIPDFFKNPCWKLKKESGVRFFKTDAVWSLTINNRKRQISIKTKIMKKLIVCINLIKYETKGFPFMCHAQATSPGFWNGMDWRALVKDYFLQLSKLRGYHFF